MGSADHLVARLAMSISGYSTRQRTIVITFATPEQAEAFDAVGIDEIAEEIVDSILYLIGPGHECG